MGFKVLVTSVFTFSRVCFVVMRRSIDFSLRKIFWLRLGFEAAINGDKPTAASDFKQHIRGFRLISVW